MINNMYKHWYSFHTSICVCVSTSIHSPTFRHWGVFSKLPPWGCGAASHQFLDPRLESWMRRIAEVGNDTRMLPKDEHMEWTWYRDTPKINVAMENHDFLTGYRIFKCLFFSSVILVFGCVIWRGVETVFAPEVSGHSKQITPAVTCAVFFECNRWMFVEKLKHTIFHVMIWGHPTVENHLISILTFGWYQAPIPLVEVLVNWGLAVPCSWRQSWSSFHVPYCKAQIIISDFCEKRIRISPVILRHECACWKWFNFMKMPI